MSINTWQQEHSEFNQRLAKLGGVPSLSISDTKGMLLVAHADFPAFEKTFEASPRLMLNLCTSGTGKFGRFADVANLEGVIRPGDIVIALPNSQAQGYCSSVSMLGIAIDLSIFEATFQEKISIDDLLPAASNFHKNQLLTSVMMALWKDAETNGLTSAFFEQGLLLILNELTNYNEPKSVVRSVKPLSNNNLMRLQEFIEEQLDSNLRVSDMAKEVNLEVRTFTRAFRASTGYAPFEYITVKRMNLAKELLLKGYTIIDISMLVGYANPSKFSAAFKRLNGKSPKEWRSLIK